MKYLLNKESSIKAIANAIRSKTGSSADLTVAQMPAAIDSISGGGNSDFLSVNIDDYSNIVMTWGWPASSEDESLIEFANSDIAVIYSTIVIRNQNLCDAIESCVSSEPNFSNITTNPVSDNIFIPHSFCLYRFSVDEYDENNIILDEYLSIPKSLRYGTYQADAGGTPIGYSYYGKMIDITRIQYDYHIEYEDNNYINTVYYNGQYYDYPNRYANNNVILLAPNWAGPYAEE